VVSWSAALSLVGVGRKSRAAPSQTPPSLAGHEYTLVEHALTPPIIHRFCRLLSPKNPILPKLGAQFPFEVAVGMNGRVWVKCGEGDEDKLIEVIKELKGRP
jgi:hypothetical protein